MDTNLISKFIRYKASYLLHNDGTNNSQLFVLKKCVNNTKQASPIDLYYNILQGLWREIDIQRPNPMNCARDIQKYNSLLQEDCVYTFLDGLDDRLNKIHSDTLQTILFPTIE
ncbi:hypothetical protein CR513_01200, partial [Mucuna pruriens]